MPTREPRLVLYSQDGLGLGHMRRTSLLATEFLRAHPCASVLTISDSPLGQFFETLPGHDYLKLPSIRKNAPGDWRPVSLRASFQDVLGLRQDLIRSALNSFQPHVVLVDHMPHGAMGELRPALESLERRRVNIVLGLRDILDSPAVVRERWAAEGAYQAVEEHYDAVLVYGSRDVFDVGERYALSAATSAKTAYCGYVCAPPAHSTAQRVRRRYLRSAPDQKLAVVTAGGGADAGPFFHAVLDALPAVVADVECAVVLVTGPFLPPAQRRALGARVRGLPVHLLVTVANTPSYLEAADLVVAMAGYNTTAEILNVGTPALLVPREGPSAEQRTRADLFAKRGWVSCLPRGVLDAHAMADAMLRILRGRAPASGSRPDLGGREVAVRRLLECVERSHSAADVFMAGTGVYRVAASAAEPAPLGQSA